MHLRFCPSTLLKTTIVLSATLGSLCRPSWLRSDQSRLEYSGVCDHHGSGASKSVGSFAQRRKVRFWVSDQGG